MMPRISRNALASYVHGFRPAFLLLTGCLCFFLSPVSPAGALEPMRIAIYPNKPIKIIVYTAAGGTVDRETRVIAPFLSKQLNTPVTIENVPGADGVIAFNRFYKEKPDGYTLLSYSLLSAIVPELTRQTNYFTREFTAIASWNVKNWLLSGHPEGFKSFDEFLNAGKQRKLSLAGMGASDLQAKILEDGLGIKFNYVGYSSGQEAVAAAAGKHVDATLNFTLAQLPLIRGGKLKPLAIVAQTPDPFLPGVPTLKELGHASIPCLTSRGGFAAPPKTPPEIVSILEKAIRTVADDPELLKMAEKMGTSLDFQSSSDQNKEISLYYDVANRYRQAIK